MNEYWKFLQFLPHPSLLSFNLLHAWNPVPTLHFHQPW
jgi:hypothetical protein